MLRGSVGGGGGVWWLVFFVFLVGGGGEKRGDTLAYFQSFPRSVPTAS